MSDMDPREAARMAVNEGADATGPMPGPDTGDVPDGLTGDTGSSLIDGFLETRPSGHPGDYPGLPTWASNGIIGTIKFVNGIAGQKEVPDGKPAIVNWTEAAIGFYMGTQSDGGSDESAEDTDDMDIGQVDR